MPSQRGLQLTHQLQTLERELADGLEHREARLADVGRAIEQALRDERLDPGPGLLERELRDLGGGFGGAGTYSGGGGSGGRSGGVIINKHHPTRHKVMTSMHDGMVITLTEDGAGTHLKVLKMGEGQPIFDGPVNSEEDLEKLPDDVRAWYEQHHRQSTPVKVTPLAS